MLLKKVLMLVFIASSSHAYAQESSGASIQGGYSTLPLREPIFDEAQVSVETAKLNNWLIDNIRKLDGEQAKWPREHLYYLIDSRIKHIYAAEKRILPSKHDLILEMLFAWSEYLGVYGGHLAFNAVKAPSSKAMESAMTLPSEIKLRIDNDMFTVQSERGWTAKFPYYFMIAQVGDFMAKGGPRTQLLGVSTGAAKDSGQLGHSQATLMLLYSPADVAFSSFESYWLKAAGIDASAKQESLGVRDLKVRHALDKSLNMHKEFVSWSASTGSYAVMYLGLEGTYQWNRPHFLDFVRSIETSDSQFKK